MLKVRPIGLVRQRTVIDNMCLVTPIHFAAAMLNDGDASDGNVSAKHSQSLFAAAVEKAGGDLSVLRRAVQVRKLDTRHDLSPSESLTNTHSVSSFEYPFKTPRQTNSNSIKPHAVF